MIMARAAVFRAAEFKPQSDTTPSQAERAYARRHPDSPARSQAIDSPFESRESELRDHADIRSALQELRHVERELANVRSQYLTLVEQSLNVLGEEETSRLVRLGLLVKATVNDKKEWISQEFSDPVLLNFDDHTGFAQIFDGRTLEGWDGDPAIWHVMNGAIVGTVTWEHPISNGYIVYHGTTARDFDLKLEIKVKGSAGSGIQYRSVVGLPFSWTVPGIEPTDPRWLMTGPQADFWPLFSIFNGQVYSENTPLRILAWRGQVVNSARGRKPQLIADIGNRVELGNSVRLDGWNQYEIVARGCTLIHIINGQLMSVEIDDDPASSNNAAGLIGIELEGMPPSTVAVRNIWLRKLL